MKKMKKLFYSHAKIEISKKVIVLLKNRNLSNIYISYSNMWKIIKKFQVSFYGHTKKMKDNQKILNFLLLSHKKISL